MGASSVEQAKAYANAVRGFNPSAVWSAIPEGVRALVVMQATTRPPSLAVFLKWEDMTATERSLCGTVLRAFGKACQGQALMLGLPASAASVAL